MVVQVLKTGHVYGRSHFANNSEKFKHYTQTSLSDQIHED